MTRYRYFTAATLDGFLADEQDSLAWLFAQEGGDDPDAGGHDYDAFLAGCGAMVMGATTYRLVIDQHVASGEPWGYTLPCFVFTHRALEPVADVVRLVDGPPAGHRAAIEEAAGGRDVWLVGGGALVADFAEAGMLHDLLLTVAPVTLGAGRPLLPRRLDLRLTDLRQAGPFACATYEYVGPPSRW